MKSKYSMTHVFPELSVNIAFHGVLGASGETIDVLVAKDVEVMVEYTYEAGHPGRTSGAFEDAEEPMPPEATIHAIKCSEAFFFKGEGMSLLVDPGRDIMEAVAEVEIEKLEEEIIKRAAKR